jgi:predicted dehydrogenase
MPRPKKELRFGIIGLGLMGREFASAAARWCHLLNLDFVPRIVGICDTNDNLFDWYESHFDTIKVKTTNYHDLLNSDEILAAIGGHPNVVVSCSSEFPFFPAPQRIIRYINEQRFGTILEVWSGLLHSSDLDPNKKINWKRMIAVNGEYGCMGDLGMHALHIPLRVGWQPHSVHAMLSKIVKERPDSSGKLVPCETWDNATLCCEVKNESQNFPMYLQTYRIAPGETNTWYIRILGTQFSIEYSTKYPKTLRTMEYTSGAEQAWKTVDLGYESPYPTITGGIFEFGFSDGLLQMWAAFCDELANGRSKMLQPFHCATPDEAHQHHRVLTAALESGKRGQVVEVS